MSFFPDTGTGVSVLRRKRPGNGQTRGGSTGPCTYVPVSRGCRIRDLTRGSRPFVHDSFVATSQAAGVRGRDGRRNRTTEPVIGEGSSSTGRKVRPISGTSHLTENKEKHVGGAEVFVLEVTMTLGRSTKTPGKVPEPPTTNDSRTGDRGLLTRDHVV